MASPSKEQTILTLLLENSPFKEWHFDEIVGEAKITKSVANKWLKKYVKEGMLKKIKRKGKFPFFTTGSNNAVYVSKKRLFALEQLYKGGLIRELISLPQAKTVILFGSLIKGDWYKDSDIDLFVYGKLSGFDKNKYERKLKRHIELHVFETKNDLKQVTTGLIKNIINGYIVKGTVNDILEAA